MTCDQTPVNTYDIGDLVELQSNFTDKTGNPVDPDTITLLVQLPNKTVQTFTYAASQITKVSTGVYTYDFSVIEPGIHYYRWEGTGACQVQKENKFNVRNSAITGV